MNLEVLCKTAHDDRIKVGMLDTDVKNETLRRAADKILSHRGRNSRSECSGCYEWKRAQYAGRSFGPPDVKS